MDFYQGKKMLSFFKKNHKKFLIICIIPWTKILNIFFHLKNLYFNYLITIIIKGYKYQPKSAMHFWLKNNHCIHKKRNNKVKYLTYWFWKKLQHKKMVLNSSYSVLKLLFFSFDWVFFIWNGANFCEHLQPFSIHYLLFSTFVGQACRRF